MISNNTVLVLGAGSSIPFGFPSGEQLKKEICHNLLQPTAQHQLMEFGYDSGQINGFRNELFFWDKTSVDEFLEHRTDLISIGKFAIAQVLISYETPDILFSLEASKKWLVYLLSKMNTTFDDFDKNNISFITFNYDRALEYFFFTVLMKNYKKVNQEIAEKVNSLNIIHLHGQLGYLPWQSSEGRTYENTANKDNIKKGAENIKIIHEGIEEDKEFKKAHELLDRAKRIFFLGFGFHPTNIKRLKIRNDGTKRIAGTSLNITPIEKTEIKRYSLDQIRQDTLINTDIVDFFRNHHESN